MEFTNTTNDFVANSPTIPCNPPCEKRPMIGRSWWKQMGYNSPCGCCLAEKKKNEEADVKVKFLQKRLKEIFAENKELKAEKLKDSIMLEEFMFEGQNLSPAEKVEMKGYWTVERVLENERAFLKDYYAEREHDTAERAEEIKILEKKIGIGMVGDNERKFFIQFTKELEENVEELKEEKENLKRIWEAQNEEQEEAKSAMMVLLCDKVNKLADKDAEIKKLKTRLGIQNN